MAILAMSVPALLGAQHTSHAGGGDRQGHEAAERHRHVLELFAGPTSGANPSEHGWAIGPTYRWRFARRLSLAAIGDAAFYGSHTTTTLLAGPFYNVTRPWIVGVAAGVEHATEHAEGSHAEVVGGTDPAFRLETGYGFLLRGGWELAPTLAVDFVGAHRTTLLGVSIGRGF